MEETLLADNDINASDNDSVHVNGSVSVHDNVSSGHDKMIVSVQDNAISVHDNASSVHDSVHDNVNQSDQETVEPAEHDDQAKDQQPVVIANTEQYQSTSCSVVQTTAKDESKEAEITDELIETIGNPGDDDELTFGDVHLTTLLSTTAEQVSMNITGHREHKHVTPDESTEKHELKHLKLNNTNNHELGDAAEQRKITSTLPTSGNKHQSIILKVTY